MTTVLVIGAGYLGAEAVRQLEERGAHTVVIDIPTHPWLLQRDDTAASELATVVDGSGAEVVLNATGRLRGSDEEMWNANRDFPVWLVGALEGLDVRLVHLGSAAEYGDPGGADPVHEDTPCTPRGIYGESKHAGSLAVLDARARGLPATVARGFNLVSANLPPVSPLAEWLTAVAELPPTGGVVEVWEADTVRDYILLEDLAAGLAGLCVHAGDLPAVVNLCSGVGLRYGDVVEAMVAAAGKDAEVRSLHRGGIMTVIGDSTRLRTLTDVQPEMSIELLVARASV